MLAEVPGLNEPAPTPGHAADKRALARVHTLVLCKGTALREALSTAGVGADVGALPRVCALVHLEEARHVEAAAAAGESAKFDKKLRLGFYAQT